MRAARRRRRTCTGTHAYETASARLCLRTGRDISCRQILARINSIAVSSGGATEVRGRDHRTMFLLSRAHYYHIKPFQSFYACCFHLVFDCFWCFISWNFFQLARLIRIRGYEMNENHKISDRCLIFACVFLFFFLFWKTKDRRKYCIILNRYRCYLYMDIQIIDGNVFLIFFFALFTLFRVKDFIPRIRKRSNKIFDQAHSFVPFVI